MKKTWPTTREALRKARTKVEADGPGDVVTVPDDATMESTATAHADESEPDTERNGNDTVPVGKKKKAT